MSCRQAVSLAVILVSATAATAQIVDIDGAEHTLAGHPNVRATIVYFVTHDCPISNRYIPEIRRICADYSKQGVRCLMAYVDPTIDVQQIREHRQSYGIAETTVHDASQALVQLAGVSVTPEAAVFDRLGRLTYRGRIDDRYAALGAPWRPPTEHDLRSALDESLSGGDVSRPRTQAVGCFIPLLQND